VPDLGGFVGNYNSAKINAIHHKFNPPSKKISFNKNLKINDGLLISHLSQRETITYQEATELVQAFVNRSWNGLRKGDKIKIEKVGTLFLDGESNIQFHAVEENNYLAESFGLNAFRAMPIKREEKTDLEIVKEVAKDTKTPKVVSIRRPLYWSAAAVLIIASVSTFMVKNGNIDYQEIASSMPSFTSNEVSIYSSRERAMEPNLLEPNFTLELKEDIKLDSKGRLKLEEGVETNLFSKEAIEAKKKIDNTKVTVNSFNKELRYHVMAGCFSSMVNAKKLTAKLQKEGFNSLLLGKYKNLNAVSYQSFATREEAIKLLAEVRNHHNGSAWLLESTF
jgi:hypothetical protein